MIKKFLKTNNWELECNPVPNARSMVVDISFCVDGVDDETEFDIEAYNQDELNILFKEFCKENNFNMNRVKVTGVYIVRMYTCKVENIPQVEAKAV